MGSEGGRTNASEVEAKLETDGKGTNFQRLSSHIEHSFGKSHTVETKPDAETSDENYVSSDDPEAQNAFQNVPSQIHSSGLLASRDEINIQDQ